MISTAPPFVLRLSKDERRVFQQNHNLDNLPGDFTPAPVAKELHPIYHDAETGKHAADWLTDQYDAPNVRKLGRLRWKPRLKSKRDWTVYEERWELIDSNRT